ncbi:MAG: pantoate kinase [Candidatus Odinarchaeota archaeon]
MRSTGYWVASHITGLFEIVDSEDLLFRGSRGAGFNIARGIETRISVNNSSENAIFFNNNLIPTNEAKVTDEVIALFFEKTGVKKRPLRIRHIFSVPMSSGFGASAGGALGTTFCLNDLFDTELTRKELFKIAHIAEAKHWCGLGDVLGLYENSSTEIRVKPGAPGIGKTISFRIEPGTRLFTCSFGQLRTSEVLKHPVHRQKIIEKGQVEIKKLLEAPSVDTFIAGCRSFSNFIGLYTERAIETVKIFEKEGLDEPAMIMLGDGLFIMTRDEKTLKYLTSDEQPFNFFKEEQLTNVTVRKLD